MMYNIDFEINDAFIDEVLNACDKCEVIFDVIKKEYLTSREITRLLVLSRKIKKLVLKNANDQIIETINILKLNDYITVIK